MLEAGNPTPESALEGNPAAEKPSPEARDGDGDTTMSEEEKERTASGEKASTSGRAAVPGDSFPSIGPAVCGDHKVL